MAGGAGCRCIRVRVGTRRAIADAQLDLRGVRRKVRRLFELMPEVQHAGLVPATDGWEWYNFFWTRGAYARRAAGEPPSCT